MPYLMEPYDTALAAILDRGVRKPDRTGIGCLSLAGLQCRYPLDQGFPLVSRRRIWPKAVFAELLWFLSGSTNTGDLNALGARFWDPWRCAEFEARHGFAEGSLGPVYGFQLRHFGGEYGNGIGGAEGTPDRTLEDGSRLYGRGGVDQLAAMAEQLRSEPHSRRIMFSLWNPADQGRMRLPPCHFTYQAVVDGDGGLTGILTQRSADFPVGVPANIQFYSALTLMLARHGGFAAREFVHNTNDAHIYSDQIPGVERYLASPPAPSPRLTLAPSGDLYSYGPGSFELEGYDPGPRIPIPVAV